MFFSLLTITLYILITSNELYSFMSFHYCFSGDAAINYKFAFTFFVFLLLIAFASLLLALHMYTGMILNKDNKKGKKPCKRFLSLHWLKPSKYFSLNLEKLCISMLASLTWDFPPCYVLCFNHRSFSFSWSCQVFHSLFIFFLDICFPSESSHGWFFPSFRS